jgi:hypothetical protein
MTTTTLLITIDFDPNLTNHPALWDWHDLVGHRRMCVHTARQVQTIEQLTGDTAQLIDWPHPFDLPPGWCAGWANGVYYGIDPDGQAHS